MSVTNTIDQAYAACHKVGRGSGRGRGGGHKRLNFDSSTKWEWLLLNDLTKWPLVHLTLDFAISCQQENRFESQGQ